MPIRKFRSVEEMGDNTWREPGDPQLFLAIRATWELARQTLRPSFPPGLYKHSSIEQAQELKARWEAANFAAYHERLEQSAQRRPPRDETPSADG